MNKITGILTAAAILAVFYFGTWARLAVEIILFLVVMYICFAGFIKKQVTKLQKP